MDSEEYGSEEGEDDNKKRDDDDHQDGDVKKVKEKPGLQRGKTVRRKRNKRH